MLFFYIRHGNPTYDPDCLTEHGKIEANALAERFAYGGLDKIYSSSCGRAAETAEPTCKLLNMECEKLDWAREDVAAQYFSGTKDDGSWTWCFFDDKITDKFKTEEVIDLKYDWLKYEGFAETKFKEGFERVSKDADDFFKDLGFEHDLKRHAYKFNGKKKYDKVALFAHGGYGMAFLSYILDIPYPEFCVKFVHLQTTGVVVIDFPENEEKLNFPRIVEFANDSHLYKNGIEPFHFFAKF